MKDYAEVKTGKKWIVIVDLEGIIGISDLNQQDYNQKCVKNELKLVIQEIKLRWDGIVTVCDIHGDGLSIVKGDMLPQDIILTHGIPQLIGLSLSDYSYAILLGFHSKAGGTGRFPHSFRDEIEKVYLNNKEVGEVGIFTNWLSLCGVRVLLVSGEGCFHDEISTIAFHEIKQEDDYICLSNTLTKKLQIVSDTDYYFEDGEVKVLLYNRDIALSLSDLFHYEGNMFEFESISDFVVQLPFFCRQISIASLKIAEENYRLICSFAKQIRSKWNWTEGGCFLRRDIRYVTKSEIYEYLRLIGVDYEQV